MKRLVFLIPLIYFSTLSFAQNQELEFPFPLLPDQETITLPAFSDTIWIMTNNQFRKALIIAKKQEIDSTIAAILEYKIKLMDEIDAEKDSLIVLYQNSYFHYRDLWTETDLKLEKAEIKNAGRWKVAVGGFYVGIGFASLFFIAMKQLNL